MQWQVLVRILFLCYFTESSSFYESESKTNSSFSELKEDSAELNEIDEDETDNTEEEEVDEEWERLKNQVNEGVIQVNSREKYKNVVSGLKILELSIFCGTSNSKLCSISHREFENVFEEEIQISIPKTLLGYSKVRRCLAFCSRCEIKKLKMVQKVYFKGSVLEKCEFDFGFVIPGSTNNWEQILEIDNEAESPVFDEDKLNGDITVETSFYEHEDLLCKTRCRIYYE